MLGLSSSVFVPWSSQWIVGVISFQKICGFHGLSHQSVDENSDVTADKQPTNIATDIVKVEH